MSRTYTNFADRDIAARALVDSVASPDVSISEYQAQMRELGLHLGAGVFGTLRSDDSHDICVVCTVEDADFLARGLIEYLEEKGLGNRTRLLCLWNDKVRESGVSISPVVRQYKERFDPSGTVFIVVKSIISGACVVKTNLTRALSSARNPSAVYVAAPVMFKGAEERLAAEFPESVSRLFRYVWFATDDQKDGDNVLPGIGGSVYERLGLGDEKKKNTHMPAIVKERRGKYAEHALAA